MEESRIVIVVQDEEIEEQRDGETTTLWRGGYNSTVNCEENSTGDLIVHKEIGVRKIDANKKIGFNLSRAKEIARDIDEYRRHLIEIGVKTPLIVGDIIWVIRLPKESGVVVKTGELEKTGETEKAEEKRFKITYETGYAGESVNDLLKEQPNFDVIKEYVEKMLGTLDVVLGKKISSKKDIVESPNLSLDISCFKCVLNNSRICCAQLEVGIDPLPANFCVLGNDMQFVDLFPPRYRKANMTIVEIPHPTTKVGWEIGYWKHYTACGILHIFFSQLCRIKPEFRLKFEELIFEYIKNFPQECVKNYFNNSCWRKVREALESIHRIIDSMTGEDIYKMREIAGEFEFRGLFKPVEDDYQQFYKDAHFEDELSAETVQNLKNRLLAVIFRGKPSY